MSRAHCVPCEESCEGLACSCACHRESVRVVAPPAPPTPRSPYDVRAEAVEGLLAAAREVLAAKGTARKLAEQRLAEAVDRCHRVGL